MPIAGVTALRLDGQDVTDVSYRMVRECVATRRREIRIEAGREPADTFIPQEHLPGRVQSRPARRGAGTPGRPALASLEGAELAAILGIENINSFRVQPSQWSHQGYGPITHQT